MSVDDQRPRRIIAAPPPLPPQMQAAPEPAAAHAQHRFQRALLAAGQRRMPDAVRDKAPAPAWRDTAPTPARRTQGHDAAPTGAGAGATTTSTSTAATTAPPPSAAPPAAHGPRSRRLAGTRPASSRSAPLPDLPPRRDLLDDPRAWEYAGLAGPAPDHWDRDLADRVVGLTHRAAPSFQSWSVTVPLDPAVLPDTELHLSLSPARLALRFQTLSPYSMALVSRHEQRLVALLVQAMPRARDIDVELS